MLEHGAYGLLLDRYYATEQGIPADQVHRLARAKSRDERAAVDAVLSEFFTLEGGVWKNGRASREVEKAQSKIKAARGNGKLGGRPKLTQQEPSGLSLGSESGTQEQSKTNPLQTPDTSNTPVIPKPVSSAELTDTPTIPCPYDRIVAVFHELLPALPRVKLMPASRQKALRKVWGWVLSSSKSDGTRRATTTEEALTWFRGYFERAASNDFLMGRTPRSAEHANWQCDLDFLMTDKGMKQVIEKTQDAA